MAAGNHEEKGNWALLVIPAINNKYEKKIKAEIKKESTLAQPQQNNKKKEKIKKISPNRLVYTVTSPERREDTLL